MQRISEARQIIVCVVAAALFPAASHAQSTATGFPAKSVRYIVPYSAGSSPDIVARMLADRLTRMWGQQVIVDNRVGVAGVMGTAYVAKAAPDGLTLIQCNVGSGAIAMSLYKSMPYDQARDFAPITRIGNMPNIFTVHPSLPVRTVQDLIAYARAHPGKLSYSSGLPGVSPQLSVEWLKLLAKVDILNVPYKLGSQAIADTIGGQVPINSSNLPVTVAHVQSGRLRPLAVTSESRAPQMPKVPTVQESGFPGYVVQSWYGACAPAGTPVPTLEKIRTDLTTVLGMKDVQQRLYELGITVAPTTRDAFDQYIRTEIARWAQVIKDAKIPQQ